MTFTVIIPTHNPHAGRLARTLAGLRAQTLPPAAWETVLVDNASTPALTAQGVTGHAPSNLRLVHEAQLGLTSARRCGVREARGEFLVFVDDDNVLAPDYLETVAGIFARLPRLGAAGGRSVLEFEHEPPAWMRQFDGLLACRDLGAEEIIAEKLWDDRRGRNEYPPCSPIGAGMALRREALAPWLEDYDASLSDRRGEELTSGGDNDIILSVLRDGWSVGYFPRLSLHHLIPAGRLTRDYLARLNRGIAKSWIQVLTKHDACPWGPIQPWTVPLRQAKAWWHYRAWAGPAEYVRWLGACGHFEGLAAIARHSPSSS